MQVSLRVSVTSQGSGAGWPASLKDPLPSQNGSYYIWLPPPPFAPSASPRSLRPRLRDPRCHGGLQLPACHAPRAALGSARGGHRAAGWEKLSPLSPAPPPSCLADRWPGGRPSFAQETPFGSHTLPSDFGPARDQVEGSYRAAWLSWAVGASWSSMENERPPDPADWAVMDVVNYFRTAGFEEQAGAFQEQEIDGKSLLLMTRNDVLTGLQLKLGPALKIYEYHVKPLQTKHLKNISS
uniref:Sterile alpha motif domain containing 13 n=1 Tax=Rattus norvegicus TaxID=10116 RepID=A0ABK0LDC3_RAT